MKIPIYEIHVLEEADVPHEDEIQSLAASVKSKGLLHPITVVQTEKGYALVAGRKRLLAFKLLNKEEPKKWQEIEAKQIKDDSAESLLEVHIHENLMRYNLPWYEQVELEKQLHDLRQQQHGKSDKTAGVKTGWSLRDTAEELQKSLGTVAQDIQLAEAIHADPLLKKIKDKGTALKLARMMAHRMQDQMAASAGAETETNVIYLGDSLDILPRFPSGVFSACITDPPWIKFHEDKTLTKDESTLAVFAEIFRVLQYNSFLYAFVSQEDFRVYLDELPKFGFTVSGMPLIWYKRNVITHGQRPWEYTRDYESILLAVKGNPTLSEAGKLSSVFVDFPAIPGPLLKHPNEKPVDLIRKILEHCSYEESLILDPFAGSGSVPFACKEMSRRYVAIEREMKYYKIMQERLAEKE